MNHSGTEGLFNQALAFHQNQKFQQAAQIYQRILASQPNHAESLHMLGVLALQTGQFGQALQLIQRAISVNSNQAKFYFHLALVYQQLRNIEQAKQAYLKAIELDPNSTDALCNLGDLFRQEGAFEQAIATFKKVIVIDPTSVAGHVNLGVTHREHGEFEAAIESSQQALTLDPNFIEARFNIGLAMSELGKKEDALGAFERVIEARPKHLRAWLSKAKVQFSLGLIEQAIDSCQQVLELDSGNKNARHLLGLCLLRDQQFEAALAALRIAASNTWSEDKASKMTAVYPSRIKHDYEQAHYLLEKGIWQEDHRSYIDCLARIHGQIRGHKGTNQPVAVQHSDLQQLIPSFGNIQHYADCPALPEGALNPSLDIADIERRYQSSQPEILHVDTLLSSRALEALRKFCYESTIWKTNFDDGYVGAFLDEGFSCPLLLQIAEELRTTFPAIFGNHSLIQAWGFKQDNSLNPVAIHADAAAINVNLWISPEEANLDPSSGGLIVWDEEAPSEWDFKLYNSNEYKPKIREFLQASNAAPVKVPYRENRALIFNSNLFHESDQCNFRDAYESRRINITFLYGERKS